jgi:hypothetical protein
VSGQVADTMVCNFLMACFRCGFTPTELLRVYSGSLLQRLDGLKDGGITHSSTEAGPSPASGLFVEAATTSVAIALTDVGAPLGRLGRLAPDARGAAAAALALGLHRWHDAALFKLLERAAIQQQSGIDAMQPAQISSEFPA